MGRSRYTIRVALVVSALSLTAGIIFGLPTGSLTITPSGSVVGGAGPLKPSIVFTAETRARVDDGALLPAAPGPVQIGFSNTDTAFAEDICDMAGSTTQPDNGHGIQWRVILSGNCNVNGFTVNAPGNPDQGTYKTENEAHVWAKLSTSISGQAPTSKRDDASVKISNDKAGNLTDRGLVEMGTQAAPFKVTGDPNENFTVTLSYGGNARVTLEALRPEVEVGGLAFAGRFRGSISAWQIAPGGHATLLKQANGVDDASWEIK